MYFLSRVDIPIVAFLAIFVCLCVLLCALSRSRLTCAQPWRTPLLGGGAVDVSCNILFQTQADIYSTSCVIPAESNRVCVCLCVCGFAFRDSIYTICQWVSSCIRCNIVECRVCNSSIRARYVNDSLITHVQGSVEQAIWSEAWLVWHPRPGLATRLVFCSVTTFDNRYHVELFFSFNRNNLLTLLLKLLP